MTDRSDYKHFLAQFRGGVGRPNRYRVEFNLPTGVALGAGEIGVNVVALVGYIRRMDRYFNGGGGINIKCHTATFPQRSLMTMEHRQNSAPFRTPYSATYDPVTFSFYTDPQLDTRDYFDVWQSAVVNLGTNTMNFYDEYVSDVSITMLDQYGEDAYKVTLYEAYPLNVGIIDASYSNNNQLTTATVTMSFKSWAPELNTSAFNRTV